MILASTVYNAYPEAVELDIDPPENGESLEAYYRRVKDDLNECGDTLFAFVIRELNECLDRPTNALRQAIGQLNCVLRALESNGDGIDEPH